MTPIKLGVILLPHLSQSNSALLKRDIAGIKLFKRLVLTLQRAGIEEIVVLSHDPKGKARVWTEADILNDPRFKGKLTGYELPEEGKEEAWNHIQSFIEPRNVLLINGNMVCTTDTIRDFINEVVRAGVLDRGEIARLEGRQIDAESIFLYPYSRLEELRNHIYNWKANDSTDVIALDGPKHFGKSIEDYLSARQAERSLINLHRHYYRQFMDFWANSFFSVKIVPLLLKTPVTPNQITLFGLVIGLLSGWLFARGDYLGGLFGGLAFVGTAVWDCCDGDVARLKFMESDFGETLDTTCDNLNNIFAFTGIMMGVALNSGFLHALIPFILLGVGGGLIFYFIYFPKGGKGSFFQGTWIYDVIQHLASRNFVYIALLFGILGRLDWFLWLAGFGSIVFAVALYITKRKVIL